jgi:hypothetical protein
MGRGAISKKALFQPTLIPKSRFPEFYLPEIRFPEAHFLVFPTQKFNFTRTNSPKAHFSEI